MQNKSGLNDFDKLFVTVALWISGLAMFAAAFSLPMLPERVFIFQQIADSANEGQSKYYNLFITLLSIIPAVIVIISASIRKRNRLQNNFVSIVLFSIMIAICMGGVIIYGITEQFAASIAIKPINLNGLIAVSVAFLFSLVSALMPMIFHAPSYAEKLRRMSPKSLSVVEMLEDNWYVGAYGYTLAAMIAAFIPNALCYIPIAVALVVHVVFLLVVLKLRQKNLQNSAEEK